MTLVKSGLGAAPDTPAAVTTVPEQTIPAVSDPVPAQTIPDVPAPETGMQTGDVLGDILYSDIVAYINGFAVPTSVKDGTTMVSAEALRDYGFSVTWDQNAWALFVEPAEGSVISPVAVEPNAAPVGTVKGNYVYTTIKTYLSGELVESFAVDGETLIDFELLAKYGAVEWDGASRALRLTLNHNTNSPPR